MFECLRIYGSAEHRDDLIAEEQIDRGQHKAAHKHHNDRITYALFGFFRPPHTEADADKGAAPISDHYRNRQRNDSQREYNCVSRIAVRPQIGRIRDKYLIHDIVKGTYQQRNNAGDRIHPHQFANLFFSEKLVCFLLH